MNVNSLDVETYSDNFKVFPYCAVCFFNKKNYVRYGYNCLYNLILDLFACSFTSKVIYVHNLNFDGFLIIEALSIQEDVKFIVFCKKNNIYSITLSYLSKVLIIKCSYKILPLSLKNIAKVFSIPSKTIFPYKFVNKDNLFYVGPVPDFFYFNTFEDFSVFKEKNSFFDLERCTIEYCKNDVLIVVLFIENLKKIISVFNIKLESVYSAPSLALKIFILRFGKDRVKFSNSQLVDKFARGSYFGGRCEVYGNPYLDDFIFHFDFTGMYAQCMKEKFPCGTGRFILEPTNFSKPGIYWIEVFSENLNIPVLPHHRVSDFKLMFTNGSFTGAYWFEEINLFIQKGGVILKSLYGIIYDDYDFIFNEYVDFFTSLRKKSDSYNIFGKLMINSIYGRLGMVSPNVFYFIDKKDNFSFLDKKIDILSHRELNNVALYEVEVNKRLENFMSVSFSRIKNNIVLASAITSKARIKLYKAQESVIAHGGRLLYSDTDSIFASFNSDVSDQRHGEVFWDSKKKDTCIKDAIFFSAKSYALKYYDDSYVVKIKGYNEKLYTFDDVKKSYLDKKNISLKNYKFLSKKNLFLMHTESCKNFNLNFYDKRFFIDFYNTVPFNYSNYQYFSE